MLVSLGRPYSRNRQLTAKNERTDLGLTLFETIALGDFAFFGGLHFVANNAAFRLAMFRSSEYRIPSMLRTLLPIALLACVSAAAAELSPADLFQTLQRKAFDYFWQEAHPGTGLVKDRAGNFLADDYQIASIAATGFGLAALPVGVEHGWITRQAGHDRALLTMSFVRDRLRHEHGWLYHFMDWRTGERVWRCEISSIDTALFLAGALLAGEYFGGEARTLSDELYRRVDFQWMLTDGGARPNEKLIGHGWKPESGFLKNRWNNYSEHLILNLLALGSPTHPIPADCWEAWERNAGEYKGLKTFACAPLFTHQYSQAFIDFRGKRDRQGFDYFESSVKKTKADRQFCIDQSGAFKTYSSNVWGLSACDMPDGGYTANGAPPGEPVHNGTIAPWVTAASLPFAPDLVEPAIVHMRQRFHSQLWGRYGFSNGFNLDKNWFAKDVIGIDLGAALLLIENHRTGKVWDWFMKAPAIRNAISKAGFQRDHER